MGQTLSEPNTAKNTSSVQDSRVKVGSSSMQGWRINMEDAHTHILELKEDKDAMFFGVYDGHGGGRIADYASKNLHKFVMKQPEYLSGDYEKAIELGFLDCDRTMRTEESLRDEMSGSTAVTVLMRGCGSDAADAADAAPKFQLYCGNVGDSRCVAGVQGRAVPLSTDHKPNDEAERRRIEAAGGYVEDNRVNGNLALSRALGDFTFKQGQQLEPEDQIVSGYPEVVHRQVDSTWDFLVLACDGIWDVLSNQEVTDFVLSRIGRAMEPEEICEELMTRCLATDCGLGGLGCDNMTVILVCLLQGKPYKSLVERCAALSKQREEERRKELEDDLDEKEAEAEAGQQQQQQNGDSDAGEKDDAGAEEGGGGKKED